MAVDKELLDKLQNIADILSGKQKNMSSGQNNNAPASGKKNKWEADQIADLKSSTEILNDQTQEIRKNVFETETSYKRIDRLQREHAKLQNELKTHQKGSLEYIRTEYKIAQKLNEIEKERQKVKIEGHTKLDEWNDKLEKRTYALKKGVGDIKKGFEDIKNNVKSILDPWGKISQAAANYAKSIGMSGRGMESLRKTTLNIYNDSKIGTNFNVSMEEFLKLRQDFVNGIGRNVGAGSKGLGDLAAMSKILGEQGATEFASKLENFGLSLAESGDRAGKLFAKASKFGISAEKMSKNFLTNISKAQEYTFARGLKGLENMAKRATELKLDMGQALAFADKVSTVEGAISTAASLQVLGGPFTQYSDAIQMLQEGLTDPEKLQERMIKMFGNMGHFNQQTGEVEVSAFNRQRIKAAAQAAGLDYSNVMEMVFSNARGSEIARQAAGSGVFANEEYLNLLKNVGTIENGQAGAYLTRNGHQQFVKAQDIRQSDMEELVSMSKSESDNIQDIAKTLRGWDDIISGTKKQIEGAKAQAAETMDVGKRVQQIADFVGQQTFLLKAIAYTSIAGNVLGAAGGAWGMVRGGVRSVKGLGNLVSPGLGPGPGTATSVNGKNVLGYDGVWRNTETGKPLTGGAATNATNALMKNGYKNGLIKATGKNAVRFAKAGSAISKFGNIAGIGGVGLELLTDYGVSSGKIKKGGVLDYGGNILGKALSYGATGAMIGSAIPVIGNIAGAIIGAAGGVVHGAIQATKNKRQRQIEEMGVQLVGSYSNNELKHIRNSLRGNGVLSDSLKAKLEQNGDYGAVMAKKQAQNVNEIATDVHAIAMSQTRSDGTQMARGGRIGGPGGVDNVPIWASRGEFIMSNKAVNMWGADRLSAMNNFANTNNGKYANGGIIKPWRGYNNGSSTNNATFKAPSTTSFADKLKVEPIKIDVSGTIKIDCGNMLKEIDASKIITDEFIRKHLAPKIEASIRQRWNAANTNVRGGDTISI